MLHTSKLSFTPGLVGVAVITVFAVVLQATVPSGWYLAGSKPAEYQSGVDADVQYNNRPSAFLKSQKTAIDGFGTLMQDFHASRYLGKRVRFSAYVKTEEVQNWAGLWMRIDKDAKPISFDNMQDRALKGTIGWQNYQVVLNVPEDATRIYFGVLLTGTGAVWINSANLKLSGQTFPQRVHSIAKAR
jgi:hypothetical protein